MIKEFVTIKTKETTAKIQASKIDAIRVKDLTKKGVRVYHNGLIGISGAIGERDDSELVNEAIDNLKAKIPYPYEPTTYDRDHRKFNKYPMKADELLEISESVMETLREDYSQFDFSQDISTTEVEMTLHNDEGLDLSYKDGYLELGLLLKEKKSGNIMDGFLAYNGRRFDMDKFWSFNKQVLAAYSNPVALPEGDKIPVFTIGGRQGMGFLSKCLNGENYSTKSSIFADKMDQVLFNEKLTVEQNRDPFYTFAPFFDMEGKTSPHGEECFIHNGKFIRVFTDKKTAADYNLPYTGSASGTYDGRPSLAGGSIRIATDSSDIKSSLNGQLAVLVYISSGGDFTPDGHYAAPVQVSFLFDGEKILGKLEEFTMTSHLYDMYGDDYIGTFENTGIYFGDDVQVQGCYMTVKK